MKDLHSPLLRLAVALSLWKGAAAFVPAPPSRSSPALLSTLSPEEELQKRYQDGMGDVVIPATGISIKDEMESKDKDRFETELVPILGFKKVAAQLVTTATSKGSFEPVRYLVSLSPPPAAAVVKKEDDESTETEEAEPPMDTSEDEERTFVLMDIPPFHPKLVSKMKQFMGAKSKLAAILVTSRDAIHYDDAPAVYRMRRTDLDFWKEAFPGVEIVAYRLDIPRDCHESMTQVLDGYGPFALSEETNLFEETGRPLTRKEWDHDVAQDILRGRKAVEEPEDVDNEEYSPQAIRAREANKKILAVYTPGHSFGSVSYVFPETGLCCSGFTIPVEDTRADENPGMENTGPALDCRGYITTSRGGVAKQMESARNLVQTYCDRFHAVLPSRGDPLILEDDLDDKKEILLDILDQYEKIGKIYEELGITSSED